MEKGYGCKTETLPTETLPALAALERGDLDINTEIWLNSVADPGSAPKRPARSSAWASSTWAAKPGISRYTAERLPELKSAADLPKFRTSSRIPKSPARAATAARRAGAAK